MSAVRQALKKIFLKIFRNLFRSEVLSIDDFSRAKIKRILLIRQQDGISQLLLTVPALRAVRQTFPTAYIAFLTSNSNEVVLRNSIYLDEILPFYGFRQWLPTRLFPLLASLRGLDLVVVFNTVSVSLTNDFLACLTRAKFILGPEQHDHDKNFCYNLVASVTTQEHHEIEDNLDLVRHLEIDTTNLREEVNLKSDERIAALEFLLEQNIDSDNVMIGFCIETIGDEWPVRRFIQMARHYSEKRNAKILAYGNAEEQSFRYFKNGLPFAPITLSNVELRKSIAVLTFCDFVVCYNSDMMHWVASVGVPSVILFGGGDEPSRVKPIGREFVALVGENNRRSQISVDRVIETGEELLQGFPKSGRVDSKNFDISEKVLQGYLETLEPINEV